MADTTSTSGAPTPNTTSKIVVHHLSNSRSQRIIWLLEELGIPYEIKKHQRTAEMLAPEELKRVHPLGKSPIITDGDDAIAESGAIVEYLIAKYGGDEIKLKPGDAGWRDNLYFNHYAEGSLMPLLVNKLIFTIVPQRTPFFIRPIANLIFAGLMSKMVDPRLKEHLAFIEAHLEKCPSGWLANGPNPTSADFMMSYCMEAIASRAGGSPAIEAYVKRIQERPAYKCAAEKGGDFEVMKI